MADFVGDLIAAASDLAHELRCATGMVLTIIGSKLEADERARVDEVGPQWLTEFEEQRDSLEPSAVCELHGAWCAFDPSCGHYLKDSAAVSAAADPSPADSFTVPRAVSDEGPGPDSVIPQTVGPGQPTCGHPNHGNYDHDCRPFLPPAPLVVAGESPGEVSPDQPSLGEPVTFDDLAAHITGDFVSGQEVDVLTATLIDGLASLIASSLLTDFNITKK